MKRSTKMLVLTPWVRFGVCVERRLTTWPLCVFPMRILKKKKKANTTNSTVTNLYPLFLCILVFSKYSTAGLPFLFHCTDTVSAEICGRKH